MPKKGDSKMVKTVINKELRWYSSNFGIPITSVIQNRITANLQSLRVNELVKVYDYTEKLNAQLRKEYKSSKKPKQRLLIDELSRSLSKSKKFSESSRQKNKKGDN